MDGNARSDLERLSAFLDGQLSPAEADRLEARLATDKQLSGMLEALRATTAVLGSLPEVRPTRSFALTEEMVRPHRAYPILQLSTAVAALGFVFVVGADLLLSSTAGSPVEVPEQAFFAADQLAEPQLGDSAPAAAPAEADFAQEGAIESDATGEDEFAGVEALKAAAELEGSTEERFTDQVAFPDLEPSSSFSVLRGIEIGLAAALIVLVGLTLWVRQRG